MPAINKKAVDRKIAKKTTKPKLVSSQVGRSRCVASKTTLAEPLYFSEKNYGTLYWINEYS